MARSAVEFELLQALAEKGRSFVIPCHGQHEVPFLLVDRKDQLFPGAQPRLRSLYRVDQWHWLHLVLKPDPTWSLWRAHVRYLDSSGGVEELLLPREVWLANAQRFPELFARLQAVYAAERVQYSVPAYFLKSLRSECEIF